ncbi:MAG: hypothetical protein AB7T49_11630 [Oligoflexales bacterium]
MAKSARNKGNKDDSYHSFVKNTSSFHPDEETQISAPGAFGSFNETGWAEKAGSEPKRKKRGFIKKSLHWLGEIFS